MKMGRENPQAARPSVRFPAPIGMSGRGAAPFTGLPDPSLHGRRPVRPSAERSPCG